MKKKDKKKKQVRKDITIEVPVAQIEIKLNVEIEA